MNLTENLKSILKTNAIILAILIALPALFFYPLKSSIDINVYTSPLKWLCLIGTVLFVAFGVQCAKSEALAKKFLFPTVIGGALFLAILAPSSGDDPITSKVFLSTIFTIFLLIVGSIVEMIRFKIIGDSKQSEPMSNILSFIIPLVVVGVGYLYNSDLLTKDVISTRWFAYIGLAAALYLNDSAFQYFRESFGEVQQNKYSTTFILVNCFFWFFTSLLFILV